VAARKATRYTIVSDVDEWTAFFRELISIIRSGELRFPKNDRVDLQLINTASTKSSSGQPFFYFKAVDTGRKSVAAKRGKRLHFTIAASRISKERVGPAAGFQITAKSVAKIQATFTSDVTEAFRKWLNDAKLEVGTNPRDSRGRFTKNPLKNLGNFSVTPKGRKNAAPLLGRAVRARATLTKAERETVNQVKSETFHKTLEELVAKGTRRRDAVKQASEKAKTAAARSELRFKQAQGSAGLKSGAGVFKFIRKGPSALDAAKLRFFELLTRVPNKDALLAIFMNLIEGQVDVFKSNTPTLSQFKLLSDGTVLSPEDGGELRDSYQIVSQKDLKNI
jgi:hypothetical protein